MAKKINNNNKYIKIGKELGYLTQEDVEYMKDPSRTEDELQRRLTTARERDRKRY